MRSGDDDNPEPNVGVRMDCLRALFCAPGETEDDYVREMAGAQWIVDDFFSEVRGIRLQLAELTKAMGSKR